MLSLLRGLLLTLLHAKRLKHSLLRAAGAKVRITKSEISMHTWRSPMSATSQAAFVVIPEMSHSDISYIMKYVVLRHLSKDSTRRGAVYARKLLLPFPDQNQLYDITKGNAIAVARKTI